MILDPRLFAQYFFISSLDVWLFDWNTYSCLWFSQIHCSSRNHQPKGDALICAGCSAYNNALAATASLEAAAEAVAEIHFSVTALTGSSPRSIGGG